MSEDDLPSDLTAREALSGISGSVSIAAWIFLLLPQLYENYKNSSAEALSVAFLIVWFLGDIANLAGAVWDGLLGTVIAIAVYFCFVDAVLLSQTFYYNLRDWRGSQRKIDSTADANDPTRPLLSNGDGRPRRRQSAASRRRSSTAGSLPYVTDVAAAEGAVAFTWFRNVLAIAGVFAVGAAAWAIAWKAGWWQPTALGDSKDSERILGAEILGYASAVLYLGARLPQIWKNYREKSCEGLSLLFFMLSTLGNLSYGAQILLHSTESAYVLKNLPWLIGSLGTIAEDVVIFAQFRVYARQREEDSTSIDDA